MSLKGLVGPQSLPLLFPDMKWMVLLLHAVPAADLTTDPTRTANHRLKPKLRDHTNLLFSQADYTEYSLQY